jgi:hypothetical protein
MRTHPLLQYFTDLADREFGQDQVEINPILLFAPDVVYRYRMSLQAIVDCKKDADKMSDDYLRSIEAKLRMTK